MKARAPGQIIGQMLRVKGGAAGKSVIRTASALPDMSQAVRRKILKGYLCMSRFMDATPSSW